MWAVLFTLLGIRGLLAAVESALYGTSDLRAKELKELHPRRGSRLLRLKTEREATAAALRFGMVLFGFTAASIATLVPPRLLDVPLAAIADSNWLVWITPLTSALLCAILASVIDTVFRAWGAANPEGWALRLSGLASFTTTLLYPVMRLLVAPLNVVLVPFGAKVAFEAPAPPLEELEKLLEAQAEKKHIDKDAPALIRSIFELSDKTCHDVMVPRTEVVMVDLATGPADILKVLAEESHSRMPAYREKPDQIVGILHVRDLVPLTQHPELIVLEDLLRPAVFVPWVKPIGDLLREMQRQKIHMAVVVDEYGGFMGIVTLEDILREIVGDIGDEFEEEVKLYEKQPDGSYLVDAQLSPADFGKAFDFQLPEGEYETLGGYLSSLRGAIPEVGDKFGLNGWQFIVQSKEGPRLDRVRVVKPRAGAPVERREGELISPRPSAPRPSAPAPSAPRPSSPLQPS